MANRLFTFGCSFTNYKYWTWATILSHQYSEFENWGQAGAGNQFIFQSFMEADQRHGFGAGDTVIVCWTDVMREDRYVQGRGWLTLGNVAWADKIYTKEFIDSGVCEHGFLLRDLNSIKAVRDMLLDRPGVTWKFLCMVPIDRVSDMNQDRIDNPKMLELYQDVIQSLGTSYIEVLGENYWNKDQHLRLRHSVDRVDYHPTTQEHLRYLDAVLPGWVTDQDVRNKIANNPIVFESGLNGSSAVNRFRGH
jgi:hypothetical protein